MTKRKKCIVKYFEDGYTMREIGKICGYSHSTVIRFLKKNYPKDKYDEIINNRNKNYQTRKYKLWNAKVCRYNNRNDRFENGKCFKFFYNNRYVPIGLFEDFVTVEIINDFVIEQV